MSPFFARSKEPCVDGMKDIRRVLAHRRMDCVPDTYGECRDRFEAESLESVNMALSVAVGAHLVLARRCTSWPTVNRAGASYSIVISRGVQAGSGTVLHTVRQKPSGAGHSVR